jgi:carbamoyltransferase
MSPGYDSGKVMGLSSYGYSKKKYDLYYNKLKKAKKLQEKSFEYTCALIDKALFYSNIKNIVLSGGYFLNCVNNFKYVKKYPQLNFFVDPVAHDGGLLLDLLYFIMIITDINKAVDLLLNQKIVALFQDHSEWGPRALGNRSLLFDPRNIKAKEIVNKIKQREWWRPFAGTILLEYVHDWFDIGSLKESPYMSFAVLAKDKAKKEIPSIIHEDNTCRIQTITYEQNSKFYKLINQFYKKTGVPILLNTSFNLAKEPLVETLLDAKNVIQRSELEYIYYPQ